MENNNIFNCSICDKQFVNKFYKGTLQKCYECLSFLKKDISISNIKHICVLNNEYCCGEISKDSDLAKDTQYQYNWICDYHLLNVAQNEIN
jgi:hypothetical protein